MFGLGAGELFLILIIALFFLGPKKLPELAESMGKAIRAFQKAKDEAYSNVDAHMKAPTTPSSSKSPDIVVEATPVNHDHLS